MSMNQKEKELINSFEELYKDVGEWKHMFGFRNITGCPEPSEERVIKRIEQRMNQLCKIKECLEKCKKSLDNILNTFDKK